MNNKKYKILKIFLEFFIFYYILIFSFNFKSAHWASIITFEPS